ncbi:MAG TPA: HypC/HybG/HupF family hydrogenase formation chaperone [Anaerolineales bacterium]|nr:HypC/HybG/HupF family hydrogenase formation chaperone [Anaerolineales bacterium]
MDDFNHQTAVCLPGPDESCSVCADEGVEGRVIALLSDELARVAMPAGEREIAIDLVDSVSVGDVLLIHTGFAIARVPRAEG